MHPFLWKLGNRQQHSSLRDSLTLLTMILEDDVNMVRPGQMALYPI